MTNILFLGCGKMGSVLAKNLLEEKCVLPSEIKVIKNSDDNRIRSIKYFKNVNLLPKNYQADLVFLAIKPQNAEKTLKEFAKSDILHKNTIFISILAGKKIEFFENIFGKSAKVVRSMPNLPIQYSQGILAYLCNQNINKSETKKLEKIFSNFGFALKLKNENLFDVVTAIFGSGPAYIFLLQEIFSEIALNHKLDKEQVADLVKQLFLGSSLMSCNSDLDFGGLRQSVTSKGGTTEAALNVLQTNSDLKNIFKNSIAAAINKSQELSS